MWARSASLGAQNVMASFDELLLDRPPTRERVDEIQVGPLESAELRAQQQWLTHRRDETDEVAAALRQALRDVLQRTGRIPLSCEWRATTVRTAVPAS